MSELFIIEQTKKTPLVNFNHQTGVLEIKGYSLPSNSVEFYSPLFDHIDKYLKKPQQQTELNFNIEYFNTSSSKVILHLLSRFETLLTMGKQVVFNWYIDPDDSDMYDIGKTYQSSINIPTNIISLSQG